MSRGAGGEGKVEVRTAGSTWLETIKEAAQRARVPVVSQTAKGLGSRGTRLLCLLDGFHHVHVSTATLALLSATAKEHAWSDGSRHVGSRQRQRHECVAEREDRAQRQQREPRHHDHRGGR